MTGSHTIPDLAVSTITLLRDDITKFQKKAKKDTDPEHIHQLRVLLRKLRAALLLFDSVAVFPKGISEDAVGDIARRFGKKRDSDMLVSSLDAVVPKGIGIANIREALDRKAHKADKAVHRALKSKKLERLNEDLTTWIKKPKFSSDSHHRSAYSLIKQKFSFLKEHDGWEILRSLDREQVFEPHFMEASADRLHDLRKQTKVVRYQFEFIKSSRYRDLISILKALQDALGSVQDMRILKAFLNDKLNHTWVDDLPFMHENITDKVWSSLSKAKETASKVVNATLG